MRSTSKHPLQLALNKLHWTQGYMAGKLGLRPNAITQIITGVYIPKNKLAVKIQHVLARKGIFIDVFELWPAAFDHDTQPTTTKLQGLGRNWGTPSSCDSPSNIVHLMERSEVMDRILNTLTTREKAVLELHFYDGRTLKQTAEELGLCSCERVRQIEAKALRRLRHATRLTILEAVA